MKTCSKCCEAKPITEYYTRTQGGKTYPQPHCKKCDMARVKARKLANPDEAARHRATSVKNQAAKQREERANGVNRDRYLLADCKKFDKRKSLDCDLTIHYVQQAITKPCHHCGYEGGRMTLDRIDNEVGHTIANTVPSCVACNLTRGDMPYAAWSVVAKAMKEAREHGLFEGWLPCGRRT